MTAEQKPVRDAERDSSLNTDNQSKFAVAGNVLPELTPLVPPESMLIEGLNQEPTTFAIETSMVPLQMLNGERRSLSAMVTLAEIAARRECEYRLITSRRIRRIQN